jgi:hypothetical protein
MSTRHVLREERPMRKLAWYTLVLTLTLVVSGMIFPTAALAQRADGSKAEEYGYKGDTTKRYLVTYMNSQTQTSEDGEPLEMNRSATVVTVTNQSSGTCGIRIDWFRGFDPSAACTTTFALEEQLTADFCSRDLPIQITACNATCDPELTFHEGRAVVSSATQTAEGPNCAAIAVSARVYYTTGEDDNALSAITDSKIVRVGEGNRGD